MKGFSKTNSNTHEIEYYGKKVCFYLPNQEDHIQGIIRNTSSFYEIEMLRTVLKLIPTGHTAIDAGANIGNHTLFFSSICGLKTHSFEPSSMIRDILENNIALNGVGDSVTVYPFALGSKKGQATLLPSPNNNIGMTRVIKKANTGETVNIETIDGYKFDNVSLIKVDVEGMELDVLRGAKDTIRKFKPMIFVELQNVMEYNEVRSYLQNEGYIVVEKYNATPTIMFWHQDNIIKYLPSFMSRGDF